MDQEKLDELARLKEKCLTPTGRYVRNSDSVELEKLAILQAELDHEAMEPDERPEVLEDIPERAEPFVKEGYKYIGTSKIGFIFLQGSEGIYRIEKEAYTGKDVLFHLSESMPKEWYKLLRK